MQIFLFFAEIPQNGLGFKGAPTLNRAPVNQGAIFSLNVNPPEGFFLPPGAARGWGGLKKSS